MTRATQVLAVVGAALALSACGKSGDPIPAAQADRLTSLLDTVQRQADRGSCRTLLNDTIPSLERRAKALPSTVDSNTRTTVGDGIAHLRQLASDQCNRQRQQTTTSSTTQSTSTSTPSTTESTQSTTQSTPSTTQLTTDTTPTNTQTQSTPTTTPSTPTTTPSNGGQSPSVTGTTPQPKAGSGAPSGGSP
jgi:septal ring factor EnvC (AmiA/AmiB activator)